MMQGEPLGLDEVITKRSPSPAREALQHATEKLIGIQSGLQLHRRCNLNPRSRHSTTIGLGRRVKGDFDLTGAGSRSVRARPNNYTEPGTELRVRVRLCFHSMVCHEACHLPGDRQVDPSATGHCRR